MSNKTINLLVSWMTIVKRCMLRVLSYNEGCGYQLQNKTMDRQTLK